MIRSRAKGLYHAHAISLCLALTASFWIYIGILASIYFGEEDLNPERYVAYWFIALLGLLLEIVLNDEQDLSLFTTDIFGELRTAGRQTLYVAGALTFTLLLTKDRGISRLFLFTYLPILWFALCLAGRFVPRFLSRLFFGGQHISSALLIGPANRVEKITHWLDCMKSFGLHVVGLVTNDPKPDVARPLPVIGRIDDLPAILETVAVQTVILLEIPEDTRTLALLVEQTERVGVRLVTVNSIAEHYRHALHYFHQYGTDFITIREEPLEDPVSRLGKRIVDIAISLPVVLFILPVLYVIVFLVQRLQSPGPVFFRQRRAGVQNRPFEIIKFRTMCRDNDDATRQATSDDDRIYPLGRLLRRTSLDEFPQFINVLRGDMSVVGPRPHMVEHNRRFAEVMASYHVRSYVKPGVTGLAQVRGFRGEARSQEDISRRVECDIEYIERWSILLDIFIILRTAWQLIFPPKSAY